LRLTPGEVENKTFRRSFRGYDPPETRSFLAEVSEQIVELASALERLQQENEELIRTVEDYRSRENVIQETLLTVRQLAEQIKSEGRREADLIIREARAAADRQLQQARDQVMRIEEQISDLRLERDSFEDRVRLAAEEHLRLIQSRREEGEVRERLRLLSLRHSTPPSSAHSTPALARHDGSEQQTAGGRGGTSGGHESA